MDGRQGGQPGGYRDRQMIDAVPHTAITYLFDPQGPYAAHWPDTADAAAVATGLRSLLG
ncbi:hypothetical protein [Streptacidiphilus anmyonensis]|uniref:hypothetical protein n=1 Tax=Streptacidiphilus anmyonensis TaxID=405782 RepID=UPI000B143B27|nr:hypothetical protein [Streptacidiphilus anmyonensis]